VTTDTTQTVCLVEDDEIMGQSLKDRLELEGIDCHWFQTLAEARSRITSCQCAAVVSDIRLPDGNGETLLDDALATHHKLPPFIYLTAYGDLQQAVQLLRRGAADYITKPFDMEEFLGKLRALCPTLSACTAGETSSTPILGCSSAMKGVQEALKKIADYDVPVLITGESGVGKEYAALFLHQAGACGGNRPFVPVNCAAIPENLLESELFGHEPGAFTGARNLHKGLFEQAQGGTLFLDEIGEMTPAMQSKLLRAIQEKAIRRVGGDRTIPTDLRLVCATNRDLREMVEAGDFREDLFFRINIIPVHIPPLRERPEDTLWFAERFICDHYQRTSNAPKHLSPAARNFLRSQDWPGNIRELHALIERVCIFSTSDSISIMDLSANESRRQSPLQKEEAIISLKHHLEGCEREFILHALEKEQGRIGDTATRLGISRKSLWERMRKHGIHMDSADPDSGH